ncbi:hypothetical protein EVAR_82617_1 [Eumeta japonica]|uniref:Uncharacterized protein n=1 Tax=Eumeta variegata TaxID=151549 RepID=A0A4C1X6H4_EUMVA|nr:hypothetical protein EVAR_82617_1 [Eumeta japonica]
MWAPISALVHDNERLVWQKKNESNTYGVYLKDRYGSSDVVGERCGLKEDVVTRVEKRIWRAPRVTTNNKTPIEQITFAIIRAPRAAAATRSAPHNQISFLLQNKYRQSSEIDSALMR